MEHDGLREQVMLITLWDAGGLATTASQAEEARELVADATEAGVSSCTYEILGFVPGRDGDRGTRPAPFPPPLRGPPGVDPGRPWRSGVGSRPARSVPR